ncbi:Ovalbumin-related protein X [Thelohanellus kitauei]|uniref:Ovalbumin-related protein X n=1 Tax=Thelohanellus kitauei TaxID=669202 RepID=A0A0C2JE11_THEKT|nr:Ovalbumin-related protein X [Thelohanellus kitauei]
MMNEERVNLIYDNPASKFRILFKPLDNFDLYSAIVLPRGNCRFIDVLRKFKLRKMNAYLESSEMKWVKLKLPKFKIMSQNNLNQVFKNYGVTDIFDRYHSDFGMMTNHSVFIENLIQFVRIDIDDDNLLAADNKTKTVEDAGQPYKFHVKGPFVFLVYSRSNKMVYISAIVTNPTAA